MQARNAIQPKVVHAGDIDLNDDGSPAASAGDTQVDFEEMVDQIPPRRTAIGLGARPASARGLGPGVSSSSRSSTHRHTMEHVIGEWARAETAAPLADHG